MVEGHMVEEKAVENHMVDWSMDECTWLMGIRDIRMLPTDTL
jgi:hypothetical protein